MGWCREAVRIVMRGNFKPIGPLPDSFETEEEAGAFCDAHSRMDYQEHLEPSDDLTA
jgi:hypothetical protein